VTLCLVIQALHRILIGRKWPAIAFFITLGLCTLTGQTVTDSRLPATLYTNRSPHSADGIGKFFEGREIALVMGHQAADWLERPEREAEEHTSQLLDELHVRPGMVVADIGAGTGYYSRRLAKLVGASGRVLAVDIQPEMLTLLTNQASKLGLTNITPVLGSITNPNLGSASIDLALLVDVYHEFDFPFEMMRSISSALKPGGQVVLVEFRGEDANVPIKELHKMTVAQVKREMALHPLQHVRTIEVLPWQHILVFERATGK